MGCASSKRAPRIQDTTNTSVQRQVSLVLAATFQNEAGLTALLDEGVDVDAKGNDGAGATALHYAAWHGRDKSLRVLLEHGAQRDSTAINDDTPLHFSAMNGHAQCVQVLLDAGADKEARASQGRTALYFASFVGHEATVLALLAAGADPNTKDDRWRTALHNAAYNGRDSIVAALLAKGADKDARTDDGLTPLQWAIWRGRTKGLSCAVLLAAAGADPLPHPSDDSFPIPPLVAAATRARLAALQPEAVAAARNIFAAQTAANVGGGRTAAALCPPHVPPAEVVALWRAEAAAATAREAARDAHALSGMVIGQQHQSAQPSNQARQRGGVVAAERWQQQGREERERQHPPWEAFGPQWFILMALRHRELRESAATAAEAAVPVARALLDAALLAQQELVDSRLALLREE